MTCMWHSLEWFWLQNLSSRPRMLCLIPADLWSLLVNLPGFHSPPTLSPSRTPDQGIINAIPSNLSSITLFLIPWMVGHLEAKTSWALCPHQDSDYEYH